MERTEVEGLYGCTPVTLYGDYIVQPTLLIYETGMDVD